MSEGPSARKRRLAGLGLALAAAALVGFTPVAAKRALEAVPVWSFGAVWFPCAGLYATGFALVSGRLHQLKLRGRPLAAAIGVGLTNGVSGLMFFEAVRIADPALVGFFTRPGTILTVLAGILFFGERLRGRDWIALAAVVAGGAVLSRGASGLEQRAFTLALGAMLATAISYSLAKNAVASAAPLAIVAYRGFFSGIPFAVAALADGGFSFPPGPHLWFIPVGSFVGPFLSFVCLFAAFKRIPLSQAATIQAVNPVFTSLYTPWIIGTTLAGGQLLGGLLATAGIAIMAGSSKGAKEETERPGAREPVP
jgi:drug/metabolite transporter (DMT)-like permease